MSECKMEGNNLTKPGTTQLSMNIDPDLKRRAKIVAISKNITLSDLVSKYIEDGLTKDENKE